MLDLARAFPFTGTRVSLSFMLTNVNMVRKSFIWRWEGEPEHRRVLVIDGAAKLLRLGVRAMQYIRVRYAIGY